MTIPIREITMLYLSIISLFLPVPKKMNLIMTLNKTVLVVKI